MVNSFGDFYRGKTVLVTGHTGFKGSWLATWLTYLGAQVVGYALEPPSDPCNFTASRLEQRITHLYGDVRDYAGLEKTFSDHRPDLVFHLAAQPLVRRSFSQPRHTFEVNLMGTVNILEAARRTDSVGAVVAVTSDKCYRNVGWPWGYRESDELGGYDPYSASKACAELAVAAYQDVRFQRSADPPSDLPIASTRAGNVVGGGDWAEDRIVPDTVRAIASKRDIVVRNPDATRPWQHVLEPLSGYLWLGSRLTQDRSLCTCWNMGPGDGPELKVADVVDRILHKWSATATRIVVNRDNSERETTLMRLDSSKANYYLGWRTTWGIDRTLDAIVAWYKHFYESAGGDMYPYSVSQIEQYTDSARELDLRWAQ